MSYRVQFEGFVPSTGATTDRALFNVYDGDERLFAVTAGLSYTALSTIERGEDDALREALRVYAQSRIEHRLEIDHEWMEASRGKPDVRFDFDSHTLDVDAFEARRPEE